METITTEQVEVTTAQSKVTQQQPSQQQIIINQVVPKHNGVGTAGFVLALLGLFLSWIPVVGWVLWALGLLLSFIGIFKSPRGLAIAGFIISVIDIILLVVLAGSLASIVSSL